ncbi:MAG: pyruvate formate lyase-activating protein [Oscillospiraceae bacterium]|nr:pyruvate formate lyase-activating protein [Oscillospiraceae bacterium]
MTGYIHSTESFGTVDGPGIRFVVFFQGCPLRCLYCHNPDTWEFHGKNPEAGKEVTAEEILDMYDGVKEFLKDGGLTCTGGEPMAQLPFLTELFRKAHERGIHTCLDTSGITFTPDHTEAYEELIKYTDVIMLDIKHIDDEEHKKLTGHSNRNILAFARFLSERKKELWIRHVVVPGITYNEEYLHRLGEFISTLKSVKALDVLPYHDMGKAKYQNLGLKYALADTEPLPKEEAAKARDIIMSGIRDGLAKERSK